MLHPGVLNREPAKSTNKIQKLNRRERREKEREREAREIETRSGIVHAGNATCTATLRSCGKLIATRRQASVWETHCNEGGWAFVWDTHCNKGGRVSLGNSLRQGRTGMSATKAGGFFDSTGGVLV